MLYFTTNKLNDTNENVIQTNKSTNGELSSTKTINTLIMRLREPNKIMFNCLDGFDQQRFGHEDFFSNSSYGGLLRAFKIGYRYPIAMEIERSKKGGGLILSLTKKDKLLFYRHLVSCSPKNEDFRFALRCGKMLGLDKKAQIVEWSSNGRLDFLKLASEKSILGEYVWTFQHLFNENIIISAATAGDLTIVDWWWEKFLNGDIKTLSNFWQQLTCEGAASNGHNDLVRWLLKKKFKTDMLCVEIAGRGNLEFLKECRELGCEWSPYIARKVACKAAKKGHIDILIYLINDGCPYGCYTCEAAARSGRLDILKYLRSKGCNWDSHVLLSAIRNEHYDVLSWSLANGCLPTSDEMHEPFGLLSLIFEKEELFLLKEFKTYGFLWDEFTFSQAVIRLNIELVQYFGVNGCPFNKSICIDAARSRFLQVFQWCIENTNYKDLSRSDKEKIYLELDRNSNGQLLEWYVSKILSQDKLIFIKTINKQK